MGGRADMRTLGVVLVCACSHGTATNLAPAPNPPPAAVRALDATRADAPPPTATSDWNRDEIAARPPQGSGQTAGDKIRAKVAQLRRCYRDAGVLPTGAVVVIDSAGNVTDVHVHGGDDETSDCVERLLRTLHFDDGPGEMLIPFTE